MRVGMATRSSWAESDISKRIQVHYETCDYCNGDGIIHCCEGDRANQLKADKWPLHQPK